MTRLYPTVAIFSALLLCTAVAAQSQDDGQRRRRGPPPEALEACEGASENDTCTIQTRDGEKQGTCRLSPRGEAPLACVPNDRPQRRH